MANVDYQGQPVSAPPASDSRPGSNSGSLRKHNNSPRSATPEVSEATDARKETPKTMSMDRTGDNVYRATTSVVKAVMALSQGVDRANATEYLDLVRAVGEELRSLLTAVDQISGVFPSQAHK